MQALILFASSFIGGLFIGFVAVFFGGIVFGLITEGIERPKEFGLAAIVLVSIFGPAFLYSIHIIFMNEALILGAAVPIIYFCRDLFSSQENCDHQSPK